MFYYRYDPNTCVVLEKASAPFKQGTVYGTSAMDLDIVLTEVVVGLLSKDKEILRYTQRTRPVEELVHTLRTTKDELFVLRSQFDEVQMVLDYLLMN